MMFWKKRLTDDERILKVIEILFPPLKLEEGSDGTKFHIDYSVDSNLDAALMDLEEGHNDPVVRNTISKCIKRINDVRRILEAFPELNSEAKYLIVDDEENDIEKIQAQN